MSTYSTNLALELIGTGEQAGSWGNTTNTNLGTLIEQAISGYVTQAVATGTDTTITIPNGATGVARNMYIELTGTGGTNTNLIVPANKKLYFIFNNSTGAVTVKVSGQTGVSVPQGKKVVLVSNGTDVVNSLNYIADFGSNSATITQLSATSATITNLTLTSLVISNLSIASANVTTLTSASATITNLINTSASITTLTNNPTFSGGTANGVLYLNGSKVLTSGSAVTYDGTTFALGAAWTTNPFAGTTAPVYFQYSASSNVIRLAGDSGVGYTAFRFTNDSGAPSLQLGKARGTYASPSAVQTGDNLGDFQFRGYGGTNSRTLANVTAFVETYTSDSDISSYLEFRTSSSGSASGTEKMRLTAAGNLAFTSTAQRVTADMSNGTVSNRFAFQTSTTNGNTQVNSIPNGTSTTAQFIAYNSSDPNNASSIQIAALSSSTRLLAGQTGTGTYLPITFFTNGVEQARLDTSGNLGIGTTSATGKLTISNAGAAGIEFFPTGGVGGGPYLNAYNRSTAAYIQFTNYASAHTWYVSTAGNSRAMDLDSSGNLGIGTTPSAWRSGARAFQSGANKYVSLWEQANGSTNLGFAVYESASNTFNYTTTGDAPTLYSQVSGTHKWFYAGSGTAGNTISFTQAMTLDASGNLAMGSSASSARIVLTQPSGDGTVKVSGDGTNYGFWRSTGSTQFDLGTASALPVTFYTNNLERARITAAGNVVAGGSVALATNATDGFLYVPTCAGTPTGTPTAITGMAPIVVNTTNNKLYFYSGGAWRDAGP